jgi:hypothetical protein
VRIDAVADLKLARARIPGDDGQSATPGGYGRRRLGGAQHVKLTEYTNAELDAAVATFDARFGEMEQVLWCLSVNARPALLAGESSSALEALVWTVKSWWGVQGVRSETKGQLARALAESIPWSPGLFGPVPDYGSDGARFACDRVAEIVRHSMSLGVPRREYSLASKVLHWLMPWRVPVYDSFVRATLGVMGPSRGLPQGHRRYLRHGPDHDPGPCLDRLSRACVTPARARQAHVVAGRREHRHSSRSTRPLASHPQARPQTP